MVNVYTNYGHLLIEALGQTLVLALCGFVFACIIGLIFGIMSVVKNRFCRAVSFVFVYAIRGVPMIVLAFFVFFGGAAVRKRYFRYTAQIFRAAGRNNLPFS